MHATRTQSETSVPDTPFELTELLTGSKAIVRASSRLRPCLESWGLLDDFLTALVLLGAPQEQQSQRFLPLLLLFQRKGQPDLLAGAVLLHRHTGLLHPFFLVTTRDRTGRRAIFSPPALRMEFAVLAAQVLLTRGASLVNLDFLFGDPEAPDPAGIALTSARQAAARILCAADSSDGTQYCLTRKPRRLYLPIQANYAATLAGIGRNTRKTMRLSLPRLQADHGCTFHPQASVTEQQFLALSRASTYPVSGRLALWRFRSLAHFPQLSLGGLQDRAGAWISLVCYTRTASAVDIFWQLNRADLARYSISLATRALQLEYESGRGPSRLYFIGGLGSQLAESFREGLVYNLAVRRRPGLALRLLERFATRALDRPAVANLLRPGRQWINGQPHLN